MLHELNQVMDYIEEHLMEELHLEEIADFAGVTDFHFRKVFFYLSGMTLSEYIKNRRLSEANRDLLNGEKVTTVAFKYRYESLDGFTRAFKNWSGFLPSDVLKLKASKTLSKLSFVIDIKGGATMEFRIEEKPAFSLAGVTKRVPLQFEGVNNAIVELAKSITEEQRELMHQLQDIKPQEIINASWDSDSKFLKEAGELTHMIGVLTTATEVNQQLLETKAIAAGTWAVFPNEGPFPATLQETMANIYAQWLPSSGYQILDEPSFSFTKMSEEEGYAYAEVWVPVKKD